MHDMHRKMHYKKCEICGLRSGRDSDGKRMFMAQFPLDEDRCKQWVKFTAKEDLVYVPIEKLHSLKYICGNHFEKKDFNKKGTRLKKTAIPSKLLPRNILPDDMLESFPCHIASHTSASETVQQLDVSYQTPVSPEQASSLSSKQVHTDHDYCRYDILPQTPKSQIITPSPLQAPSTSSANQLHTDYDCSHIILPQTPKSQNLTSSSFPEPSTSSAKQVHTEQDCCCHKILPQTSKSRNITSSSFPEPSSSKAKQLHANHDYCSHKMPLTPKSQKRKRSPLPDVAAVQISSEELLRMQSAPGEPLPSTSRAPLSTSIINNYNVPILARQSDGSTDQHKPTSSEIVAQCHKKQGIHKPDTRKEVLVRQLKEVKSTIRSLRKNAKLIEQIESPLLKEIVTSALKNQKRKPRGHRWTTKYKISCLAIHKRSPRAYRYLQHLLPLPSVKTLQNIFKKVPMEPGISSQILKHLRRLSLSYDKDKYCCLLFDEMAIKPRLN